MEQSAPATKEPQSPIKKSSGYVAIVGVIIVIVALIAGVLIYKSYQHSNQASVPSSYSNPTQSSNQTAPVTPNNADQVLDQTGAALEQDLNQMDQDSKSLDQNDATQDSSNNI